MMDFNLILLLVGLGLLLLVSVFVLLGCFAGLKKELNCAAIGFVVLLLALLVFGESSTILNLKGTLLKDFIQGIPSSAETIWDCILALVQTKVPGGAEIFVEGSKSYAFLYSVVSGVARGAMLIVGTFVVFIIATIGIGIYRLVTRIVAHSKAKRRAEAGIEEPVEEDKAIADNVLVAQSEAGEAEGVMITANKTEVKKGNSKHRVWAGCLAGLRAVIAIIFLFAPVSGVASILDEISPETEKLINESLSGNKQNTAADETVLDIALDFKDAYYNSAVGKFIEGSSFFFGDSFSTHLFDSAFTLEGQTGNIEIREEAIVIIDAVNALEGNTDIKSLQESQIVNALNALKDSELLVEAVPVVVEVAYYYPLNANGQIKLMGEHETLKDFLFESKQQAAFLELRQLDWDKNIEILLDVVAEAYKLGFLEDDFNVLTMDPEILNATLSELAKSDAVNSILNMVIQVALKLPVVTEKVGTLPAADLSDFDWGVEYKNIVGIYKEFQKLGITSLEGIDTNELVSDILNDEEKLEVVTNLVNKVTKLQLVNKVAYDVAIGYVSNIQFITDKGTDVVQAVKDLAKVDWSKDINLYVEALRQALPLVEFEEGLKVKVDYLNLDADQIQVVFDTLFATESFEKILPIGANIALGLPKVQELLGSEEVVIDTANINWKQDFTTLVNIYKSFQELGVESLDELKQPLDLAKEILSDDAKVNSFNAVLNKLASLDLFNDVAVPAANAIVAKLIAEKAPNFEGILDLTQLSEEEWKNDFADLVLIAQNVYEICGLNFTLADINFTKVGGDLGTDTIALLFGLNLLDDDEAKNNLVLAALKQFKVISEENLEGVDLSEVVWTNEQGYSEVANLQAILTIVGKMSRLEGVDINNGTYDLEMILDNDETYEYVVDLLDVVVDSKLMLELLPSALQQFVVPLVKDADDEDGTLNDVITGLESSELVKEVQKLVDVAKAVVELNVLKVKEEGIQAIDLANTEAIKTIINGIFDSKILEGYEGRLVRILLRATNIFPDLEKGAFDHVDFDREQALLISAIDELEIVLQDENFLTFDENNKIVLNKEYYLQEETLDAFLNALDVLFGKYTETGSTNGSEIIEVLLPEVIAKFVCNLIPEQFEEVKEILNLENLHTGLLADDVRKVLYIVQILVDEKVQSYLLEKEYYFEDAAEAIKKVVSTIFDLNLVKGSEAELVSWALNYVQSIMNVSIENFTPEYFAEVDWKLEVETINGLVDDFMDLLTENRIFRVGGLLEFIKEKQFLEDDFLREGNYDILFAMVEKLFNLQLVEEVLPVGLEYALYLAKQKNIYIGFLGKDMTSELLVEDIMSIVDALKVAVYDVQILEYKKANWTGDLPEVEYLVEIVDIIFNLNIVEMNENQILSYVVEKFLPANKFVAASDFQFDEGYEFDEDLEIIKKALPLIFDLIKANNLTKVEEVKAFFAEKWFANTDLVKDYNLLGLADLVELLSDLQLVKQALVGALDNVSELEALVKLGDFSSLTNLTQDELSSDLKTLATIARQAVAANLLQYYELHDLDPINYDQLAEILATVGTLNVINNCANEILPSVLNNVLKNNAKLNLDYEFTAADFEVINWTDETVLLGEVLVKFGALANDLNLDSLSDILLFINNKDFTNSIVVTTENVNKVVDILNTAVESKLIQAAALAGVEFAMNFAKDKGFDITFLKGRLTGEQLLSDLDVIVEIVQNAVDFGAIEYLANKDIENINADYVVNIVALLEELNILTCAQPEWTALLVSKLAGLLKLELDVEASDYANINYAHENELLQNAVQLLGEILGNENLSSVSDILAFIQNKDYLDANAYNDRVIDNAQDLLLLAAESEILGLHLVDLAEFGIQFADSMLVFDLSFFNDQFSNEELQADIRTLVEISEHAVEFGIVDLIFTGDVVINVDPVIEVVKLLEELNILNKTNEDIAALVVNLIAPTLKLEEVKAIDFRLVDFADENALLVEVLEEVKVLLEVEGFDTVSDVLKFIKNREYLYIDKYEQHFSEDAVNALGNILNLAVSSDLVQLKLVEVFNYAISLIPQTIDLSFLKNSVTCEELVSDVDVLVQIAKLAIEFGALEYVFTGNIENINLDVAVEIVALLEQLNLAVNNNKEFTALVFNFVYPKLGINAAARSASVNAAEFANIDYASENVKLQEILALVKNIQADFNLVSLEDVKAFVNEKQFMNYKDFEDQVYTHVQEIVNAALDSELVQYALPTLADFGLDKASAAGIDLTYLSGVFTGEQLASDVKVLLNEVVRWVRDLDVFASLDAKEIQGNYVNELANTVRVFKDVNILTYEQAKLVTVITNLIYGSVLKFDGKVSETDFADIDWNAEIDNVANVLAEISDLVETFGVRYHILSLEGLKEFASTAKDFTIYNEEDYFNYVAEILVAISESKALAAELEFAQLYLVSFLHAKGIDAMSIISTAEEISADLVTLSNLVKVVYPANVLGYAFEGEALNQEYFDQLVVSLEDVLAMNVLSESKSDILAIVFDKLGVDIQKDVLDEIDWTAEISVIGDLLHAANDALLTLELTRLADFSSVDFKQYLTVNYDTNDYLAVIKEVLEVVVDSQLVEAALLPVSEKFLANEKLAGLADLHNIYVHYNQVEADLNSLIEVIEAVIELDLCSFLVEGSDIPYANKEAVETVITNVLGLNYLNTQGRLAELAAKATTIDSSSVDFSLIDLKEDAKLIVAAYESLLPILTDPNFFIKNLEDLKPIRINIADWTDDEYVTCLKDALTSLLDTTIIEQTNGAIFLLAIPVFKQLAPEYYQAIDPERLTVEQLSEDFTAIADLVEQLLANDISALLKGMIFNADAESLIVNAVNTLNNLNLLENRFDDVLEVVANSLDSKKINGYYFDKELYNISGVLYHEDLNSLVDIITLVYDVCEIEGIATLGDLKEFVAAGKASVKQLLNNDVQVANVEQIARLVTELTIVKYNILPVYNQALKDKVANVLPEELANVDDVYDSSIAMTEDLVKLIDIAMMALDLGVYDVYTGAEINFDQAALVKELLNTIASIEYVNAKKVEIYEFVDEKVKYNLSQLDITSMDLANDLAVLGEIYEQLIPVLLSEHNPFTDLAAVKAATITKSDLYALIYDYQTIYPSVVELVSEISIAPEVVRVLAEKVSARLSGLPQELVNTLDVESLSDEEIIEDLLVGAEILTLVEELDLLRKVLYKEDILVTDNETIALLAEKAFELNAVDNNFQELVALVLEDVLNLDLTNVDLTSVDVESEQALLVNLVNNGVVTLNTLGVEKLSEVKPYLRETLADVKADVKEAISLLKNKEYKASVKALVETLVAEARKLTGAVCLEIVDLVCESELVAKLALPVYEQKIYTRLSGTIADLADLSAYDETMLASDLALVKEIVHNVYDSKIYHVVSARTLPGEECLPYLEEIVLDLCELNIVDVKLEDLAIVLEKVYGEHIDVNAIDFDAIDLAADKATLAGLVQYAYVLVEEILNNGLNRNLVFNTVAYNAVVDAYEASVDTTLVQTLAPQVIKATLSLAAEKLGGLAASVINTLKVEEIADSELLLDLPVYAEILRDLEAVNAYAYLINKEDIQITDSEALAKLVEDAFKLVVVDYNFGELLVKTVEKVLGVDLSGVDLTTVDLEAEQELIVELVRNGVESLNAVGVEKLSEVKPYAKELLANVKADVKESIALLKDKQVKPAIKTLVDTLMDEARKLSGEACLNLVDLASESKLVAKLALPVYEQLIYTRLSGILAVIGDVSAYDEAMLAEDLSLLAEIAHDIYDSKLYKVVSTRTLPGVDAISYLEEIIRNAAKLNIVEVKKADVLVVAQALLDKVGVTQYIRKVDKDFDLAKYDASSISFKADADIYASMAPYAYAVMEGLLESGFNASFLGNTDAIYAIVEMYTIAIDTTLVKVVAEKALNALDKVCVKVAGKLQVNLALNQNDEEVLYNISEFLNGLVELGVFGNEGIDLTDAATIQMMKEALFDSVTLPGKVQKAITKVCNRAWAYGVLDFNWNEVSATHEAKVAYKLAKQLLAFVKENASSIKALDLSILADAAAQADLSEMAYTIAESSIVDQLFFQLVEGTFNALTLSYTDGVMEYDATLEDVLAYSLPNFWKVVNATYEITAFKPSNINLTSILSNLNAVAEIVEVFGTDIMLKDNAAKIIITAVGYLTSIELSEEEINGLLAIDFANEVVYSNAFFAELQELYDATNFNLSFEEIKNPAVLSGVADALEAVLPSETVKVLARLGVQVVNGKFVQKYSSDLYALIDSRINDESFTNEQIVEDYYRLAEMLRLAGQSEMTKYMAEFANWNYAPIKQMVAICFDTNLAKGNEEAFAEACIKVIPHIGSLYEDTMVIADWEKEILTIVNALESLVNDGIANIDDVNMDNISGQTVEYICDSVVLSDILVDTVNEKLEALGLQSYYQATQAKLAAVTNWDAELAAIKDLNNLLDSLNNGTYVLNEVVDAYEGIKADTVLVNEILTASAEYMVPKMPVVKDYYDSSIVISDWAAELDAIVGAIKKLDSMGLDAMDEPINNLTGESIMIALESEILTAAFVEEFNNNLSTLGLGSYYTVSKAEVEGIQNEAKWDAELAVINQLETLVASINAGTVTLPELQAAKTNAESTVIAKAIFEAVLAAEGIIL